MREGKGAAPAFRPRDRFGARRVLNLRHQLGKPDLIFATGMGRIQFKQGYSIGQMRDGIGLARPGYVWTCIVLKGFYAGEVAADNEVWRTCVIVNDSRMREGSLEKGVDDVKTPGAHAVGADVEGGVTHTDRAIEKVT